MKRYLLSSILFLLAVASGFSQAPPRFNYQAVARDVTGAFLVQKPVAVIVTLTDDLGNTYTESHSKTTNQFGLFSLEIGGGTTSNDFSSLKWAEGKVTISISVNGTPIGTEVALLSVPYALYANNAGNVATNAGTTGKNILGGKGIKIDSSKTGTLTINSTLDSSKYVKLDANPTTSGNYLLVWNGTTKTWKTAVSNENNLKIDVGTGLKINNNKITLDIERSLDTSKGFLRVNRIVLDSIDIPAFKENFILKVKDGKLRLVADSAIQYKSESLKIGGDTIGLKAGSTKGDVLAWDGGAWKSTASIGSGWSLTGNTNTKAGENYIGTNDKVGFKIKTDNKTRMTFDETGNVVFGTPDSSKVPRAAFEQRGKVGSTAAIFGGDAKGVSLITSASISGIGFNQYYNGSPKVISPGYSGYISLSTDNGNMSFSTSNTFNKNADSATDGGAKMTLTKDGKLGITGTAIPTHKLTVGVGKEDSTSFRLRGYGRTTSQLLYVDSKGIVRDTNFSALSGSSNSWSLNGNPTTTSSNFIGTAKGNLDSLRFNTDGKVQMVINGATGNVAIGENVATQSGIKLYVNGKIKTSNITESSDIRYKKNIQPITNALDKVQKLTGVSYNWRQAEFPQMIFEKGTDLGLIAQEVEKVLPELVNTDDQGYKSVEYSHLVSVLVEAIKEQQKQIESLKSEISTKETKVRNNESRIQSLETSVQSMASQMQLLLELVGKNEGIKASK